MGEFLIFLFIVIIIAICICACSNDKKKPMFTAPVVVTSATHHVPGTIPPAGVTIAPHIPPGSYPHPQAGYNQTQQMGYPPPQQQAGYPPPHQPPYPMGMPMPQPDVSGNPPSYEQVTSSQVYQKQAPYNPNYTG